MDKDSHCTEDWEYLESRYRYFRENEEIFFDALDAMLDVATLFPLCEREYGRRGESFRKSGNIYQSLKDMQDVLESYNIRVTLSSLLKRKVR